jgi:hypothetical protein
MTETALFITGAVITAVAFTGIFLYAMLTFSKFAERENRGTGQLKRE